MERGRKLHRKVGSMGSIGSLRSLGPLESLGGGETGWTAPTLLHSPSVSRVIRPSDMLTDFDTTMTARIHNVNNVDAVFQNINPLNNMEGHSDISGLVDTKVNPAIHFKKSQDITIRPSSKSVYTSSPLHSPVHHAASSVNVTNK